jgi:hypothetical protein
MNEALLPAAIDVTASLFWVLRVAAGVGGAVVGWFVSAPVVSVLFRAAFQRAAPRWLSPWVRLAGACLIGLLVFYFLPLGGGSGFGWGPGAGGGPGLGPGDGTGKTGNEKAAKQDKSSATEKPKLETLDIELIGGKRYQEDGRFYLIRRQEPVVNLDAVADYLEKNKERLAEYVNIVLTPASVDAQHGAVLRLRTVIEKHGRIPLLKSVNAPPGQ